MQWSDEEWRLWNQWSWGQQSWRPVARTGRLQQLQVPNAEVKARGNLTIVRLQGLRLRPGGVLEESTSFSRPTRGHTGTPPSEKILKNMDWSLQEKFDHLSEQVLSVECY